MKHRATVPDALETPIDAGTEAPVPAEAPTVGRHAALVESPEASDEDPEEDPEEDAEAGPEKDAVETGTAEVLPAYVIPETASWKSRHLGRTLLAISTAAAFMAVVPAGVHYWQMRTDERMQMLVAAATFAIGMWSILASRRPQVVCLSGSMLTVRGRQVDETFDLADFLQRVELSGNPRKMRWSLRLARVDNTDLVLGRHDVDAIQLDPIVRYYRDLSERRRSKQWNMLGLGAGATRT